MNRTRLTWAALLTSSVTFLGCPSPEPTDPSTDASTPYEWDGQYTVLEETGNWKDTGRLADCTFPAGSAANCQDLGTFDLSGCDTASLANAATEGKHLLTARIELPSDGGYQYHNAFTLNFNTDGGPAYLNSQPVTETREGNVRMLSSLTSFPDGGTRRTAVVLCEAPQAPAFTGCYAFCRNGRIISQATFKSERLTWRPGESEASGLELVSENRVDIGYPVDVYVTKNHAYVVSVNHYAPRVGGLTVFDVSDKAAPVRKKTIQIPGDNYWNAVWSKGDALYVGSANKGLLVFDITNPADPVLLRNLPGGAMNTHTLFVDGDRLYTASSAAIIIYDIRTPTSPVEVARYSPASTFPHDMFAVGDRLYANYADQGYFVADVSNLNDIRTLGRYTYATPFTQYSHAGAVGTFAGRTIAFMGGEGAGEHLRVLDVTDPAHMVKIGEFQLRPAISIHNMLLVGRKLYLSWYQEGVRVLDVSNPTRPTQVAYYNTYRENDPYRGDYYDGAMGIRVPGDGYIYVVDTSRGLLILREP
jgi:hypothetical protein